MADFSNIKFNGVEYGLKDRASRQDINALGERVTQVENKIPEILEFESFDALQAACEADPTKFVEGTTINLTKGDYCEVATYGGEFYDYVTGYCPPQIFRLSLNPYEDLYCFFLYQLNDSEGEFYFGEMFLFSPDYDYIEFRRIESPYTLANPPLDGTISIDDLPELSAVRASNGFYKIPANTSKVLKPKIIEFHVEEYRDTAYGVWFYDATDTTNNNELAKYLYYGLAPIACPYTEFDVLPEGVSECRPIAAGEIRLSYTTHGVHDFINDKSYSEGWGIQYKLVKTSPSDPDEYGGMPDGIGTGLIIVPMLVLDNGNPKIIFDIVI